MFKVKENGRLIVTLVENSPIDGDVAIEVGGVIIAWLDGTTGGLTLNNPLHRPDGIAFGLDGFIKVDR